MVIIREGSRKIIKKEKWRRLVYQNLMSCKNNFSFNDKRGATRGLHAEPWEKYVSVANGSVFGAWVDLRKGPSFATTFSIEINPGVAAFPCHAGSPMAIKLLKITSPIPTSSTLIGRLKHNTLLFTYLTQISLSIGPLVKTKQLFPKKILITRH